MSNNLELRRLFAEPWPSRPELFAVESDFEPPETAEPWWKFWKRFRNIPGQLADWGADTIFDGPNDLVVDTPSMTLLGQNAIPSGNRLDLSNRKIVHHCAYFRQPEVAQLLIDALKL